MRTALLPMLVLCWSAAAAQNDVRSAPAALAPDERVTMLNDSVRQVEIFDPKTEKLRSRRIYIGDRPTGIWQEFDKKGQVEEERDFSAMRYGSLPARTDTVAHAETFTVVEEMPEFPGGEAALYKFLGMGIRYPQEAVDAGKQGVVYLTAIIDETGDWNTVSILRGADPYLDYEAWRISETMPNWTPGKQAGKPVRVQYNLPIRFTLR